MDTPETEDNEHEETVWSEALPDGAPVAFAERNPAAFDDETELYLLDRHAAEDGTVRVQLLGWERDGDIVRVAYVLPTGERHHDRYRWPTAGRYDESDFLALVRALGYPPGAAGHIAGEFARARAENGRFRIVTGRQSSEGGGSGESADRTETDGSRAELTTLSELRVRVQHTDPMTLGSVAVALLALAVGIPAALAAALGGLSTPLAALGGGLAVAALAMLAVSIAAAR